jgi:hypothetical protein
MKRALTALLMSLAVVGLVPVAAQATECVQDTGVGTVDDKVVGQTCWDCGWIEIRGKEYLLFYCD